MSTPASKKQRPLPTYELLYWPGMPGRGEFIRLPLEAAGASYRDISNESKDGIKTIMAMIDPQSMADAAGNPPVFAPPALRLEGAGKDGGSLLIHQTPAILSFLGPKIGMVPEDEAGQIHVHQIACTALDLSDEAHDSHHPIAVAKYYEDQKEASLAKSTDFRIARIPKFFGYFERVLKSNPEGNGTYFIGDELTYADTTVWQVVDGLIFAFPKELAARKDEFPVLLGTFYPKIKEEKGIKEYLSSERRQSYSNGIFRHYPELDRQ